MTTQTNWPKVAVIGAGAVGGYFGGLLARSGVPVTMVGRQAFVEAVQKNGLRLDTTQFQETLHPAASAEIAAAAGANYVLFCVKTTDTAIVAKELARHISPACTVLSLQNGVNNVEEIHNASGIEALPTVVYVAASMPVPGTIKHFGRGDLVIGPHNAKVDHVAEFFERAKLPCRVADNIEGELWTKLLWNCALNAISALGRATYGEIIANEDARRVVQSVVYEVLAVAQKNGIRLAGFEDPKAALEGAYKIGFQMSATYSSTAQDVMRGKRTEISSLNGYIAKLGAELGVPTPVNLTLYTLVKLLEAKF
jgi:2-dehydropantoate 2-reductase